MMLVLFSAILGGTISYFMTQYLSSPRSFVFLLDHPNARSLHNVAKPRTGGLAILSGLLAGCLPSLWLTEGISVAPEFWLVLLTLVLGAVSFWDDRRGLHPLIRISIHAAAAVLLIKLGRLSLDRLEVPLLGSIDLGAWVVPLSIFFIMWMTNLYNFMDGLDGLAGGMTVIGCLIMGGICAARGDLMVATPSLMAAGAAAGYLFFNFPPARIFMGDVGSVSLGFLTSGLTLMGVNRGHFDLWVPLLIFSPFMIDATVTLLRRAVQGARVWQAHREHYYQRLVLAGWGHRKTLFAEYALMGASGLSAVAYRHLSSQGRLNLLVAWVVVYTLLIQAVRVIEARNRATSL